MLRSRWAVAILIVSLIVPTGVVASEAAGDETGTPPTIQFLYLQNAAGGSLQDGVLTLTGVPGTMVAMAERPYRVVQELDVATFAQDFEGAFAGDPPNAILLFQEPEDLDSLFLKLDGSADYDADAGTLTMGVTMLGGPETSESTFKAVRLVIDAGPVLDAEGKIEPPLRIRIEPVMDDHATAPGVELGPFDPRHEVIVVKAGPGGPPGLRATQSSNVGIGESFAIRNESGGRIQATITDQDGGKHAFEIPSDRTIYIGL